MDKKKKIRPKGVDPREADKTPEERKKTPKKKAVRTADDYDDDDELSEEAAAGIKQCEKIKAMIEQIDRPGIAFLSDVHDQVSSMAETIERINKVTERQQSALDNWEAGVGKWMGPPRTEGYGRNTRRRR
jgi:hypothetical protein